MKMTKQENKLKMMYNETNKHHTLFKLYPETINLLNLKNKNSKKIIIDLNWNEMKNEYEVFEFENYYLTHITIEYYCLGSADADYIEDKYFIEFKEWETKKVNIQHWEDGLFSYIFAPENKNRAKYLMNLSGPKGFIKWKENEYQDFDNFGLKDYIWYNTLYNN